MSSGSGANNFEVNGGEGTSRPGGGQMSATDPYSQFNRLIQLFPKISPRRIQRLYDGCGRDVERTIRCLLYARRLWKSVKKDLAQFKPRPHRSYSNPLQQGNQEGCNVSQGEGSQQQKPKKRPQPSFQSCMSSENESVNADNKGPKRRLTQRDGTTSPESSQASQGPGISVEQSSEQET